MPVGFALHDIILDENGSPCDYRFIEINPAFEEFTGLKGRDIIGKTVLEVIPNLESFWIERYGKVALGGETIRFEQYAAPLDRYYEVLAYCPKQGQFVALFSDITKRKKDEEQIEYLAGLVENVSDGIISSDAQNVIRSWNRAAEKLYGWSAEEVIGKEVGEVLQEKSQDTSTDEAKIEVDTEGKWKGEVLHKKKNGTMIEVLTSISALRDSKGELTGTVAINSDITERKMVETAISFRLEFETILATISASFIKLSSEALDEGIDRALKSIAEFASAARCSLFLYSQDLKTVTNTHEWCADPKDSQKDDFQEFPLEAFGYYWNSLQRRQNVIVQRFDDIPSEASREREWSKTHGFRSLIFVPMLLAGKPYGTLGIYGKVGEEREWPSDFVALLRIASDIFVNVLERKRTEKELQESEKKFRNIIESIPLGMHMYQLESNRKLVFIGANPAANTILGVDHTIFINKKIEEAFPAIVGSEIPEKYRLAASTGTSWQEDQVIYEDSQIQGAYEVHAFQTSPGKMVAAFLDVTERKKAEAEKEFLIADLEAKNVELEQFTYTVSHDLKSPLITIKGFLGLLEQEVREGTTGSLDNYIGRISNAVDKMSQLLSELLELSRIGRLENPPEWASITELAQEALDLVSGQVIQKKINVKIAPDLPRVYGDRIRLRQILENLLANAAKFIGDAAVPQIEIGNYFDGNERIFYVQDNGIGISSRYHERIFDLFEKLQAETEGSGVGLTIVKRIVEVHGGRIWVESDGIGQGAKFCFTLSGVEGARSEHDAEEAGR